MNMEITKETTFGQLKREIAFSQIADYLMVQQEEETRQTEQFTFGAACGDKADVIVENMIWLKKQCEAGKVRVLDLYTDEEKAADPDKEHTSLIHIPGKPDAPYVIVCSGGAYVSVCNVLEGFPAAQIFTEKGYHVFILSYRVGTSPLLPRPQEDLAQAVHVIEAHAEALQVLPGDYAVCGFSAGAHLAGSFGTDHLGYAAYGLPEPGTLMLAYPAVSVYAFDFHSPVAIGYINTMIGPDWTKEKLDSASVECDMSGRYPPTFLTHSRDDSSVPFHSSEILTEKLEALRIPYRFKPVDGCEHGFSVGFGESAGWLDEACDFWEEQRCRKLFTAEKINDHITRIQGACMEYMYLIEGKQCAALIDTGTGAGDLHRFVGTLTDKPVQVLLSHGHLDHAMGTKGFAEIYMNPSDDHLLISHSDLSYRRRFVGSVNASAARYLREVPVPAYLSIRNGQEWDLGGVTIRAFECPGHTTGSVVFLLREDRILFLGDACNSNTLVYDPAYSTTVEEYRDSLIALREETEGLYDHTIFSHEAEIKGDQIVSHMIDLCTAVLGGISDEAPVRFGDDEGLMAKTRNEDELPADGSDVNFMYRKERLFREQC